MSIEFETKISIVLTNLKERFNLKNGLKDLLAKNEEFFQKGHLTLRNFLDEIRLRL